MTNTAAKIKTSNTKTQLSITCKFADGATFKFQMKCWSNHLACVPGSELGAERTSALLKTEGQAWLDKSGKMLDHMSAVDMLALLEEKLAGVTTFTEVFERLKAL